MNLKISFYLSFYSLLLMVLSTKLAELFHISSISQNKIIPQNKFYMSKADREKKKKKASEKLKKIEPSSSSTKTSSTPWRVSSNQYLQVGQKMKRIPVKVQIAWAKAFKRLKNGENKQVVNTKRWKQDNVYNATVEEYTEIDYVNTKPPAVFVDGYNIIGFINMAEGRDIELDDARDCLISDLSVLQSSTGWYIEVIFDAYDSFSGVTKTEAVDGIFTTYTSQSETADGHIERRFSELRSEGFSNMIVATDDNALRMVAGSQGAGYISANLLLEELRIAYRGWEQLQEDLETEAIAARPKLGDNLSDDLKLAIEQMKLEAAGMPQKIVYKKMTKVINNSQ